MFPLIRLAYATEQPKKNMARPGQARVRGLFEIFSLLKGTFTQRGQAPVVVVMPTMVRTSRVAEFAKNSDPEASGVLGSEPEKPDFHPSLI